MKSSFKFAKNNPTQWELVAMGTLWKMSAILKCISSLINQCCLNKYKPIDTGYKIVFAKSELKTIVMNLSNNFFTHTHTKEQHRAFCKIFVLHLESINHLWRYLLMDMPYGGTNIVDPGQVPRVMRGVLPMSTITIVHKYNRRSFLSLPVQFQP